MRLLITLVMIFPLSFCFAGETLSLQKMVDNVFVKNPQIREIKAQERQSKAELKGTRAPLLPVVQGSTSLTVDNDNFKAESADYNTNASVGVRQTVFDMSIQRSYAAARFTFDSKTASFDMLKQQLAVDAALLFIDLWEASIQDTIARFNCLLLKRHYSDTRTRFEAGELTNTDVHWAQGRLDDANSSLITVEKALKTAKIRINELGCEVKEDVKIPNLHNNSFSASDTVLIHNRYDILSLMKEVRASEATAQAQLWRSAPSLSGYAQSGYFFRQSTFSNQAGITLDVSILDGGLRRSGYKAAQAQTELLNAQLERAVNAALRELSVSRNDVLYAQKLVELAQSRDSTAKLVFDGVTEEFKAGTRTIQDAHDAQNELFLARTNLVKERAALLRSIIRMRFAAGIIDISKMEDDQ